MFKRLRGKWRAWRRRRRAQSSKEALREFVYLDDVSVYSLLASKLGPIASEFTSTEAIGLTTESSVSAGVGVTGRAGMASSFESSSQVVRKAIVQTAFRDLMIGVGPDISFVRESSPDTAKYDELSDSIPTVELSRGRLLEAEVILEADQTYKLSTVITSVSSFINSFPGHMPAEAVAGIETGMAVNKMLEQMTLGLIPIRCRVLGARATGSEVVLTDDESVGEPLFVVGVTQAPKYWRDTRLVLFSQQRYRMLCRVASDGFVGNWKAIRGRESLGQVFLELDTSLAYFETGALHDISRGAVDQGDSRQGKVAAQSYLQEISLARNESTPPVPEGFDVSGLVETDVDLRREAFERLEETSFEGPSRDVSAVTRAGARHGAFLAETTNPTADTPVIPLQQSGCAIEVEVVAIYW